MNNSVLLVFTAYGQFLRFASICKYVFIGMNINQTIINESHTSNTLCVITGFLCEGDENCALLGYYEVSIGNFLPTLTPDMRSMIYATTMVRNHHYSLRNNPEECSSNPVH